MPVVGLVLFSLQRILLRRPISRTRLTSLVPRWEEMQTMGSSRGHNLASAHHRLADLGLVLIYGVTFTTQM